MPCKQNKSYKTKLNQCYPINPSLRNFYKTIHDYACTALTEPNKSQRHQQKWFSVVSAMQEEQLILPVLQEEQLILPVFLTMNLVLVIIL